MLDIQEIENSIKELEKSSTTYDTCSKLASLYIVRDRLKSDDVVEDELNDILPSYRLYKEVKRKYQLRSATVDMLCDALRDVVSELNEFLHILYSCTDTEQERAILTQIRSA